MNTSGIVLIITAFGLGFRHGFDLDHIATIDAITRTTRSRQQLSKMSGILFSSGHGLIVTAASLIIGSGIMQSQLPAWLDPFGVAISIFFLFAFGFATLWNVLRGSQCAVSAVSLKARFYTLLLGPRCHPVFIMLIGALYAISFDTLSQAALFSISASLLTGWLFSGILGVVFTLGMMLSDGINGYFVSALIGRTDKISLLFSSMLGLMISVFSLSVGAFNLSKLI
ncbi:High-affinity nickel transport protein [Aquicella siphonis]|uniref:Nickel/cobalt efflux system n=1 Tax=Aquicella siphonis TaxID=254247 RepID=A0A5E4PG88_9COXI|nr:DNA repair protein [Aquicella siphonis]VVC75528.1 High-affinity nickel transport protein [Aquicella siphonis]